jgi:hypothetical protein
MNEDLPFLAFLPSYLRIAALPADS